MATGAVHTPDKVLDGDLGEIKSKSPAHETEVPLLNDTLIGALGGNRESNRDARGSARRKLRDRVPNSRAAEAFASFGDCHKTREAREGSRRKAVEIAFLTQVSHRVLKIFKKRHEILLVIETGQIQEVSNRFVEQELQNARQLSLIAARRGEYAKVAQLTLWLVQLSALVKQRNGRDDHAIPRFDSDKFRH